LDPLENCLNFSFILGLQRFVIFLLALDFDLFISRDVLVQLGCEFWLGTGFLGDVLVGGTILGFVFRVTLKAVAFFISDLTSSSLSALAAVADMISAEKRPSVTRDLAENFMIRLLLQTFKNGRINLRKSM
jgi:hypothetical protein